MRPPQALQPMPAASQAASAAWAGGQVQEVSHRRLDHALRLHNGPGGAAGTLNGTSRRGPATLACKEIA